MAATDQLLVTKLSNAKQTTQAKPILQTNNANIMPTITAEAFHKLGSEIASNGANEELDSRTFIAFYGASPTIMAESWERLEPNKLKACRPKHLVWTCMFIASYHLKKFRLPL